MQAHTSKNERAIRLVASDGRLLSTGAAIHFAADSADDGFRDSVEPSPTKKNAAAWKKAMLTEGLLTLSALIAVLLLYLLGSRLLGSLLLD
ncbi:hypothetical protein ELG72_37120 [Rhizobium leguminosarum]|uniref:hypothetical protein n=1 Tax=Rhizobium TaxID=379 RepID=UPI001031E9CD|nr:hypothetical protein [Rhizobium leguminosarum]TBF87416.1 hypothetical protein ELG82_38220 [Rhizobium leguminosarum]TBG07031.1 hypothetical protein ELG80_37410 [Rhizobium leguminosarum]TBG07819.1 hypothetical protein ELG81_37020 [Rhizobium leguminosarum]TBG50118.1 hypothetical protein ELG72_37120 [Rhizobium leguminosarum]TBG71621.1 hypothetical protein ELG76_36865 [Rhizobium leguminosarum]